MQDFVDRIPLSPGRRKITREDGTSEYVTMELADEPTRIGTELNRKAFMALQGFETLTTTFNSDGTITEKNASGDIKKTVFNSDGSISEIFTGTSGLAITKKTVFNSDGSISEVISS